MNDDDACCAHLNTHYSMTRDAFICLDCFRVWGEDEPCARPHYPPYCYLPHYPVPTTPWIVTNTGIDPNIWKTTPAT